MKQAGLNSWQNRPNLIQFKRLDACKLSWLWITMHLACYLMISSREVQEHVRLICQRYHHSRKGSGTNRDVGWGNGTKIPHPGGAAHVTTRMKGVGKVRAIWKKPRLFWRYIRGTISHIWNFSQVEGVRICKWRFCLHLHWEEKKIRKNQSNMACGIISLHSYLSEQVQFSTFLETL